MTLTRNAAAPLATLVLLVACSPADPSAATSAATPPASSAAEPSAATSAATPSVEYEDIDFPGDREPRNIWSVAVNGHKVVYADKPSKGTVTLTLIDTAVAGAGSDVTVDLGKASGVRVAVDALMTDPASGHDVVVWSEAWATEGRTPLRSPDGRPQLWRINATDMQTGTTRIIDEAQRPERHYWAATHVSAAGDTIVWTRKDSPGAVSPDTDAPHSAWTWTAGADAPTRFAEIVVHGENPPELMTNGTVAYLNWQASVDTWTTEAFALADGSPVAYSPTGDLLAMDDTYLYFSRPADGTSEPVIVRQPIGDTSPGTPVGDPTVGRVSSIVVVGDGILAADGDEDRFFLDTETGMRTDFSAPLSGALVLGDADGVAWEVQQWWDGTTRHFTLTKVTLTR